MERGPATAPRGAAAITAAELRDYLTFISADDMEGRNTPSRGLNVAANFLAENLSRWGFTPAGDDGTYFQRIALTQKRLDPAKTTLTVGDVTFKYGDDFLAAAVPGTAEGGLVYVGHGYIVKAKNIDAYKGLDVSGKILVALSGYPSGVGRGDVRGDSGPDKWESPATYAAKHGARGIVYVPDFRALASWGGSKRRAIEDGTVSVDKLPARAGQAAVPSVTASAGLVAVLFENEQVSGDDIFKRAQTREAGDPFTLKKSLKLTVETVVTPLHTQNVVAILEGSDPVLKKEYVAIGAHYDHVGVGTGTGDVIYNGADDDGSGTTAVLAMAEAFAKLTPRPKRSLLFVWHAGEERGLWGSDYVTRFPPVPMEQIVTQLNIDMIGRSRKADDKKPENQELTGPDEVYVIGSKMMSSDLGDTSERVNKEYLNLQFNYKYDDPKDPNRFFFRSDHYNYARKGVPIIFYFSGVHEDYHKPSDSIEKIDFAKMEKVTRTVYAMALTLADAPARPRVDKKLPAELTED
jgi:Zn-dependent M28 family amino/carboxypeptidase